MIQLGLPDKISDADTELLGAYIEALGDFPQLQNGTACQAALTKEALGSQLFFDANLSLTRSMSCSSCHNLERAFIDARFHDATHPNPVAGALSLGDDDATLGGRNAPTAAYAQFTPAFTQNAKGEYVGGQFHDGRAATLKEQAKGPFLDPAEMMMPDAAAVIARVQENPEYVTQLKSLYGDSIFDDTEAAYDAVAESIAKFEKTEQFAPFDSKYDRSKLPETDPDYYEMTALEREGHELFFNAEKTNCVQCHAINSTSEAPTGEVFTNFKYDNIGTPKNVDALMARDGSTDKIDLGLGGRSDIDEPQQYGKFRIPTLRNVAVTGPYMSNGVFKELRTVLEFYDHMAGQGNHSLNPETGLIWDAPEVAETVATDLLTDTEELTDERIDALMAFLKLLTDELYEGLVQQ